MTAVRKEEDFSIFRAAPTSDAPQAPSSTSSTPLKQQPSAAEDPQPAVSSPGPSPAAQQTTTGEASTAAAPEAAPRAEDAPGPSSHAGGDREADAEGDGKPQEQPPLTEAQQVEMLAKAERLKAEGNTLYGQGQFQEATDKYAEAVEAAPPSASKQRAVYLANMAACDVALKQYKEAVQACTAALEEDATFVKAYMRRAVAYKELDDLDHALVDARKVLELDPSSAWAQRTVKELEPVVAERHEKLKDEMLGKLKDLGNTILGKFGMSLDNFKATKDPNSGSYSISFQQ